MQALGSAGLASKQLRNLSKKELLPTISGKILRTESSIPTLEYLRS